MKINLNYYLPMLLSILVSITAHSESYDPIQKYYDDAEKVISNFRECSTQLNQFSNETNACLKRNQTNLSTEIQKLLRVNATTIEQARKQNLITYSPDAINHGKKTCLETFPEPLRLHFKNQILSCETQIDLNVYLKLYNDINKFKSMGQ